MLRALLWILLAALLALWSYFAAAVAPLESGLPVAVAVEAEGISAESLNNEGVRLAFLGRHGDALEYLKRAHDFRPLDATIASNLALEEVRVRQDAWARVLGPATGVTVLLLVVAGICNGVRRGRDRAKLSRVKVFGHPWFLIPRDGDRADLALRFSEPLDGIVARYPLTIVWSSAVHGKHMKSRPPVAAEGKGLTVKLEGERLERLRRYPGEWRGFLYLGRHQVGEAAARVV